MFEAGGSRLGKFTAFRKTMLKQTLCALALTIGMSTSALAASFSFDWQPVSVCEDATTCGTLDFDAPELERIFAQADIQINILPLIRTIDPVSFGALSRFSTSVQDVLNNRRPGAVGTRFEPPLITWILENAGSFFQGNALVGRSGALVAPPAIGSSLLGLTARNSRTLARGISQNLGLVTLMGDDCAPDNIQNVPGSAAIPGTCTLGTSFTASQIDTMQSSRFLSAVPEPTQIPLPAGFVLLVSGLAMMARRARRN